jgi:hypothetical protein
MKAKVERQAAIGGRQKSKGKRAEIRDGAALVNHPMMRAALSVFTFCLFTLALLPAGRAVCLLFYLASEIRV